MNIRNIIDLFSLILFFILFSGSWYFLSNDTNFNFKEKNFSYFFMIISCFFLALIIVGFLKLLIWTIFIM